MGYRRALIATVICSLSLGAASAQLAKRRAISKGPRALGLVEVDSQGRGHLVPVAIMIDGQFYDASVYKADPVPMSLEPGTVYEGVKAGVSQGLFTVSNPIPQHGWLGLGSWKSNEQIALKDYKGKWVVLYFYPRADTPGCTIEACSFRDSFKRVEKIGAVVLGVSPDTAKDQKKFSDKFDLPFTLVEDDEKKICNAYGVIQEKNMYGRKVMGVARTTFIIGPDGKIKHIFEKVKPEGHAEQVLEWLKEAQKGAA